MISRTVQFLKNIALKETSPKKLALSSAVAMYITWTPFLGFHTIMLIVAGWALRLNVPFMIAVGYGVNNPWTMVPIYMAGYLCGYWLLHVICAVPVVDLNPVWMLWVNQKAMALLGIQEISFWAFMLGGNVLGVLFAFITYPVALHGFKKMMKKG